jgi:hypothetical protein
MLRRRTGQCGILRQDRLVHRGQCRSGVDAQILG